MKLSTFLYHTLKNSYDWDVSENDIVEHLKDPIFWKYTTNATLISNISSAFSEFLINKKLGIVPYDIAVKFIDSNRNDMEIILKEYNNLPIEEVEKIFKMFEEYIISK